MAGTFHVPERINFFVKSAELRILSWCEKNHEDYMVTLTQNGMARACGMHRTNVIKALNKLISHDILILVDSTKRMYLLNYLQEHEKEHAKQLLKPKKKKVWKVQVRRMVLQEDPEVKPKETKEAEVEVY